MGIRAEDVLRVLGKLLASKEVKDLQKALGEEPDRSEHYYATFRKHHFYFGIDEDAGRITEAVFPEAFDGEVALMPFGLTQGSRRAVHDKLGKPTSSARMNELLMECPFDVFDLPEYTVDVSFTLKEDAISSLRVRLAADCAEARAERAAAPKPKAKKPRKIREGAYLDALIAAMAKGKKRRRPKKGAAALLETKLPADLRRFLETHAAHDHGRIDVGDYKLEDDVIDDAVPGRDDRIVIGRTAGGDLWVVERSTKAKTAAVSLALHEEEWLEQKHAPSLDAHIAACAAEADPDMIDIDLPKA